MKIFVPANLLKKPSSHSSFQRVFSHFFLSKSTKSSFQVSDASNNLYKRISPVGRPDISIAPVLDQWVREGNPVDREQLCRIIEQLKVYKRFKHALEVSLWMTDKRYIPLTPGDVGIRITLIFKVDGLKAVENYFNTVPEKLKGFPAHISLLNCYVQDKSVEKAEAIMQKLRVMGCNTSSVAFNLMMNLHYRLGNWKMLDDLMHEMEEKGIKYDQFTYGIRLSAYAAAGDIEGVDKIALMMETDPHIAMDYYTVYPTIAQGYLKVGHLDKVLAILKKMEGLAIRKDTKTSLRRRSLLFDFLLKMYAEIGRKDAVYRIWTKYKKEKEIFNKGYISMMSSLSKFNDVEGMENIFKEWESRGLSYDLRIPNVLIQSYCGNGQLEKAEALISKGLLEGGEAWPTTWYYMAEGYILNDKFSKAVEALRKAILTCQPNLWPSKEALTTSLEYFESRGATEKEEGFVRFLKANKMFPGVDHDRLLQIVKHGEITSS